MSSLRHPDLPPLDLKSGFEECFVPSAEYPERSVFAVDWDGTCVEEEWPGMGDWLPGAIDGLKTLAKIGKTVIYTMRTHLYDVDDATLRPAGAWEEQAELIEEKLAEAGIEGVTVYPPNRGKPPAKFYIDDRNLRFEGDWPAILAKIGMALALGSKGAALAGVGPLKAEPVMESQTGAFPPGAFGIKDSGARAAFGSGMVRDVEDDKPDYTLIRSGPMFVRWAIHLLKGAKKYGRDNWQLAAGEEELARFRRSAARHFEQWLAGELDEDHAAAVFFNINGFEYVKSRMAQEGTRAA